MHSFGTDEERIVDRAVSQVIGAIQGIALSEMSLELGLDISLRFAMVDHKDRQHSVIITAAIPPVVENNSEMVQATIFVSGNVNCPSNFRPNERAVDNNHTWIREMHVNRQ